jgi:hypothetical protein
MALVNSYLHASQNKSQPVKQSKKADVRSCCDTTCTTPPFILLCVTFGATSTPLPQAKAKNKDKPKRVLKRSEQTTEAVVQELQKLYQNSPDSCVKSKSQSSLSHLDSPRSF